MAAPTSAEMAVASRRALPLKLPKRFRIVLSHGFMAAAVQESAVGRSPCSVMKSRMAASAKSSADPALFEVRTPLGANLSSKLDWADAPHSIRSRAVLLSYSFTIQA